MMPEISFPAHTQARMAAAKVAKELKKPVIPQPSQPVGPPALPGHVTGLTVDARQAILQSKDKAIIGYGTLEELFPLCENANLAMLQHYVPHIIENFKFTRAIGEVILLPDSMKFVTERGVKYVVEDMGKGMKQGSFSGRFFTKNKQDQTSFMIRPRRNVVDMIHALNTLRAFGLDKDAEFLARQDGPIMVGLKRRAMEWTGGLGGLERFIKTMDQELLQGPDRELLAGAWAVYDGRAQATRSGNTSSRKA